MENNGASNGPSAPDDFLRLKHTYIFDLLFDVSHDRNLSRQDFIRLQKTLGELETRDGTRETTGAGLAKRLGAVWAGLLKGSRDYRRNALQKHISLSEWLEYWSDFVRASRKLGRKWPESSEDGRAGFHWHSDFVELVFDVMDAKGDGAVDEAEYTSFLSAFGVSPPACQQAFTRLSPEGSPGLTRARFSDLWLEFLTSTDPSDPGNFLFADPATSSFHSVTSDTT